MGHYKIEAVRIVTAQDVGRVNELLKAEAERDALKAEAALGQTLELLAAVARATRAELIVILAPRCTKGRVMDQWALDRVERMASSARINAGRLGVKILKGHGYPDEVMSDAQDALALDALLEVVKLAQNWKYQRRYGSQKAINVAEHVLDLLLPDPSTDEVPLEGK